jgi:predicted nucleic acid-binding protein
LKPATSRRSEKARRIVRCLVEGQSQTLMSAVVIFRFAFVLRFLRGSRLTLHLPLRVL